MTFSVYVALVLTLSPPPYSAPVVNILGVYSTRELCEGQIARLPTASDKRYYCYGVYAASPSMDPLLTPLEGDFPTPNKG